MKRSVVFGVLRQQIRIISKQEIEYGFVFGYDRHHQGGHTSSTLSVP